MPAFEFLHGRWMAVVAACLSAGAVTGLSAAPWSGTHKAQIQDPAYGITAATLQVPNGWRFAGTVVHDPTCRMNGNSLKFTELSSDGTAFIVLPGAHWMWNSDPAVMKRLEANHCAGIDLSSASTFLINIAVPNLEPGAKVVGVQGFPPEIEAKFAEQQRQEQQQFTAISPRTPAKVTIDGARARIQFSRNGRMFEEEIGTVVDCNETKMPAMYKLPGSTRRNCTARNIAITRAPAGHLDALLKDPQLDAIRKSVQPDASWAARVQKDGQAAFQKAEAANTAQFNAFEKADRDRHAAQMAQGAQFQQQLQHSTDQAMAADRAHQDAMDASAHATALHSLDRQEFRNPNTGEVIEASDQYNHQWLSQDGKTLIQTNDSLNPNGVVDPIRQSWTELEPKPLH